jgi:hypothetical protein
MAPDIVLHRAGALPVGDDRLLIVCGEYKKTMAETVSTAGLRFRDQWAELELAGKPGLARHALPNGGIRTGAIVAGIIIEEVREHFGMAPSCPVCS